MNKWLYAGTGFIDGKLANDVWIEIENRIIASISQNHADWEPKNGVIISRCRDGCVLPGLIDTHVHLVHCGKEDEPWQTDPVLEMAGRESLKALYNAQKNLAYGVTTVRDLGSRDLADIQARDAIAEGMFDGPRIIAAGHPITSTAGHMDSRRGLRPGIPYDAIAYMGIIADSAAEARTAVRRCLLEGSDVIKVNVSLSETVRNLGETCAPEMTYDVIKEICEIAHQNLRKVTAHSHGGLGVDNAIKAGIDSFEHGRFFTEKQFEMMAKNGICLTPTLSPDARIPLISKGNKKAADIKWTEKAKVAMYASVKKAKNHGVTITAGSDAGMAHIEHGQVAWEIEQLSIAGLSANEAILAATTDAAKNIGLQEITGRIAKGLCADLVIWKKNPLANLDVLKDRNNIEIIINQGEVSKTFK